MAKLFFFCCRIMRWNHLKDSFIYFSCVKRYDFLRHLKKKWACYCCQKFCENKTWSVVSQQKDFLLCDIVYRCFPIWNAIYRMWLKSFWSYFICQPAFRRIYQISHESILIAMWRNEFRLLFFRYSPLSSKFDATKPLVS